jgi:hypothetical protein
MRPTGLSGAAGVVAASLATIVTLAALPAPASAVPVEEPGPGLMRHFAFFQTEPEGLPAELRQVVANSEAASASAEPFECAGANPALAQELTTRTNRLWVVPGNGCMYLLSSFARADLFPVVVDIATTPSAVKHGMAASTTGIVPDGVIAVRLSRDLTVPVRHGVYYISPSDRTDALWRGPKLVHGATASG